MEKGANPVLVIFVDALPFNRGNELAQILGSVSHKKVTPGVGYSINVKTELFSGINPDEVGYFCEWNYTGKREMNTLLSWCLGIASKFIANFSIFDKVAHTVVRKIIKQPVYGIPLQLLPYMKFSGPTAYEHSFSRSTFLSEYEFRRVLYSELGVDDNVVFQNAICTLEKECPEKLFVATAELDGVMHEYGMHCDRYENQIELISEKAELLVKKFMEMHGEAARYFIFSDHGMADVMEPVDFDVERIVGKSGPGAYGYFFDATFLRVWMDDENLCGAMEAALNKLVCEGHGVVLDGAAREKYGLTDKKHGDYIFLLDEGKMFCPSFFGRSLCKAMHGYEPELESQQGALITNVAINSDTLQAKQIYQLIEDACSQ